MVEGALETTRPRRRQSPAPRETQRQQQLHKARVLLEAMRGFGRRTRLRSSPAMLGNEMSDAMTKEKRSSQAGSPATVLSMGKSGLQMNAPQSETVETVGVEVEVEDLEEEEDERHEPTLVETLALLQQLQQQSESGSVLVRKDEMEQIVDGFIKALESTATKWSERGVEHAMQRLFVSHANVFDEKVQNFIIQNYIQETESAKTFRTALRRTSLVRRCLRAMYPSDKTPTTANAKHPLHRHHSWRISLAQRALAEEQQHRLEACPEIQDPETVHFVKSALGSLSSWDFDLFALADAVPGETLMLVGNALLETYNLVANFNTTKSRQLEFLRQIQLKYHPHAYHNAEHAADVAQSLHHILSVGGLGETVSPRSKCAAIIAAIIHDVGHTSYSNNFHIARNDDLAVKYVYRSPLEHMHCALSFQIMKNAKCNLLQGLTTIEQLEIRNLITDMVLATDNSVHAAYLAKLEGLVCRASDENWKQTDPDDERLVLQMALHTADVSNPAKPMRFYSVWAERILHEFYEQGDKERELQLPVSIGYDRENPIPLEKMQAGFILGIVRPLFSVMCRLPRAQLAHCMSQLDENLAHWQNEIERKQ
ncbi:hypothetical protein Poli38472_012224 [Pythium oligandrum]|uniref:PDEase domain-containing protein n=1 Tax=Pythium oligandrum TaxID=41045 RepID=A0A8K1FR02_PYTOL|nr:hypothetical protein Poli38472_012224 [Pythium oligandrum]|eukprot:TMW67108.1 hypothetical protein Poli38472_012224 [Pythium oligandrum]